MSKGTKQIRFGRIQKKIDEMELLLKVVKQGMDLFEKDSSEYVYRFGYVKALEMALDSLKELENPINKKSGLLIKENNHFETYEFNMNTVDYVYWLARKGGWSISESIYLRMDDKNIEDTWVEIRDSETDKVIDREIDSSEAVIEWLENNGLIEN